MKTWKLVSGILSIVIFFFVALQSCAAGFVNAVENNGQMSGTAGIMVGILMLVGGIVSIATRYKDKKGGNIALIIIFALASIIGFVGAGNYKDLNIWAAWCLINALLAYIALKKKKPMKNEA